MEMQIYLVKLYKIKKNARAHAVTWNTQVKTAFDTLTGIIEYDTKFENYYETLVEAINTGNGDTLKKGLQIYRRIQQNQKVCKSIKRRINSIKKCYWRRC